MSTPDIPRQSCTLSISAAEGRAGRRDIKRANGKSRRNQIATEEPGTRASFQVPTDRFGNFVSEAEKLRVMDDLGGQRSQRLLGQWDLLFSPSARPLRSIGSPRQGKMNFSDTSGPGETLGDETPATAEPSRFISPGITSLQVARIFHPQLSSLNFLCRHPRVRLPLRLNGNVN